MGPAGIVPSRRSLRSTPMVGKDAVIPRFASATRLLMHLPFFYGWLIVAVALVTMGIGFNVRTAFSPLFPPILDEFGWERGVTAGAFSFGFLVSAGLSPLLGRLMDHRGPRLVIEMGVGFMAAGMFLATLASLGLLSDLRGLVAGPPHQTGVPDG